VRKDFCFDKALAGRPMAGQENKERRLVRQSFAKLTIFASVEARCSALLIGE
jgi:hypothetical protein